MLQPRYLRFARALALLSGVAAPACSSGPAPEADVAAVDASQDRATVGEDSATRDAPALDAAGDTVASADAARDGGAPDAFDAAAPRDDGPAPDASERDVAQDVVVRDEGVVDAGPMGCPPAPPASGEVCNELGQSCNWDMGFAITFCTCEVDPTTSGKSWSCSMAVPGPMPPPELPS